MAITTCYVVMACYECNSGVRRVNILIQVDLIHIHTSPSKKMLCEHLEGTDLFCFVPNLNPVGKLWDALKKRC